MRAIPFSIAMSLIASLPLPITAAHADATQKLIVTLDTPDEASPEIFCIIGEQECKQPRCSRLSDIAAAMSFHDKVITFDATRLERPLENVLLGEALEALSPQSDASNGGGRQCGPCTPQATLVEYIGTHDRLRGHVTCTKNRRPTRSDRVAIAFLRFHKANVPAPMKELELLGNHLTVYFSKPVDPDDYEFLIGVGGDYLANTEGLGTKERMVLPLHPRCTASTIALPPRVRPPAAEALSATLDGEPVDRCVAAGADQVSVWLPYRRAGGIQTLRLAYASPKASSIQEASWTGRTPPDLLTARHRQVELAWRKDCLVGSLPATANADWSASCPRATLPAAGATCELLGPDGPYCRYRCAAPPGMPAFELPTPVRFDRLGLIDGGEIAKAYGWEDTLRYAGQELTSFLPPDERKIIVELPDPAAWRSRPGNEIDRVEIQSSSGTRQSVSIRTSPPRWAILPVPNATCNEHFTVKVIGARTFDRKEQGLSDAGNLVLDRPRRYRDVFHWVVVLGGGALLPQNQLVYDTERDLEPYGSAGGGFELDFERPFSGAFEATLLYEPTRTSYGVVRLPTDRGDRLARVPYHRIVAELAATLWGRNREWQLGLMGGAGFGGPMLGDTEKVGTFRSFVFAGALGRIKPWRMNAWIEVNAGTRWGEAHQFFGTGEHGELIPETFHGEPERTERRLVQLFGGLRMRIAFL